MQKPDETVPVVRRAGALDPAAAWFDAVIDVVMLGPMDLFSGLLRAVNRLLL